MARDDLSTAGVTVTIFLKTTDSEVWKMLRKFISNPKVEISYHDLFFQYGFYISDVFSILTCYSVFRYI